MNKADGDKKSNDDVLRAGDIIPPYDVTQARKTSQAGSREKSTGPAEKSHRRNEIPRFDLAEQILTEQRKVSSIRRKAPDKKIEPTQPVRPVQEQIIAEIVAKDIRRLLRSEV